MPDRGKVIRGLEVCVSRDPGKYTCYKCPYETAGNDCEIKLSEDALALLKEQDEERKRLISWMGKFCAHVDTDFQPMQDEENTRFFCEKMRTQFGWEVSGDAAD